MELFAKIANSFQPLTISAKSSILDAFSVLNTLQQRYNAAANLYHFDFFFNMF